MLVDESTTTIEEEEDRAPAEPMPDYCRHCGKLSAEPVEEDADWLCEHCERYQDSTTCPTCRSVVRISLLPAEAAPAPHKRKGKGE